MIMHSTPATRPIPAINPAAGTSSSYTAWAANGLISRNGEPLSSKVSMRSRGSSLPWAQWRAWACSPPPWAICANKVLSSVSCWSMAPRLVVNSGEWVLISVLNMAIFSFRSGLTLQLPLALPMLAGASCGSGLGRSHETVGLLALAALLEQFPTNQHPADFTGAGADLIELGVTQ